MVAWGLCWVSDEGTAHYASDLHNAQATIINPFVMLHSTQLQQHTTDSS